MLFYIIYFCIHILSVTSLYSQEDILSYTTNTENSTKKPLTKIWGTMEQKAIVFCLQGMHIFSTSEMWHSLITYLMPNTDIEPLLLFPLPNCITNTINKFRFPKYYFTFFNNPNIEDGAYISSNCEIHIGSKLLTEGTPEEITFITGHEIAHHVLDHHSCIYQQKYLLLTWWILMEITHYSYGKLLGILEKKYTHDTYPRLHSYICKSRTIYQFLDNNSLVRYIISAALGNFLIEKIYQYREKQADFLSVQTTGAKEGGISYFKRFPPTNNILRLYIERLVRLLLLPFKVNKTHPSDATRVAYLENFSLEKDSTTE